VRPTIRIEASYGSSCLWKVFYGTKLVLPEQESSIVSNETSAIVKLSLMPWLSRWRPSRIASSQSRSKINSILDSEGVGKCE
jgi:hypothetical protein